MGGEMLASSSSRSPILASRQTIDVRFSMFTRTPETTANRGKTRWFLE
jgi:hypothetical protein